VNLDTIEARVAEAFVEDILVEAGYWVARGGGESQLQTSLEKRLRRYARFPRLQESGYAKATSASSVRRGGEVSRQACPISQ
jgi:hypothetical protein